MADLVATAEQLQNVNDACSEFIALWAVEQLLDQGLYRMQVDILNAPEPLAENSYPFLHSVRRMDD